jgi:hypothetical protein
MSQQQLMGEGSSADAASASAAAAAACSSGTPTESQAEMEDGQQEDQLLPEKQGKQELDGCLGAWDALRCG